MLDPGAAAVPVTHDPPAVGPIRVDDPDEALPAMTPDASTVGSLQKITPYLWFDGAAEEAARFYVTLLPDSRIERVTRSPADTPSGPAGTVLTVEFTLVEG